MDLMECLLSGVSNLVGEIDIEQIFFFTTKTAIAIDTRKEKARGSKDKSEEEGHCTLSGSSGKASPRK